MRTFTSSLVVVVALAIPGPAWAAGVDPGAPAPDFTLKDLDGKPIHLADYKGKVVILEWFNPECPYVRASHSKGSLVGLAKKYTAQGVVWLAVNSGAPGKQGAGAEKNRAAQKTFGMEHAILVDESGQAGHAYGATNTPHLYVISKEGKVLYKGAIDNSPDGEGGSPEGGKLVNYVDRAMEDLAAGRSLRTPLTKAYGCSVKYGS
jgi:peroxiredoxin